MEILGLIIGVLLIIFGYFVYMIKEFSGVLLGICGVLITTIYCNSLMTSDTAKKYEQYIELKREHEQDSINKLHYKWNKDLDNKIKKLKDE